MRGEVPWTELPRELTRLAHRAAEGDLDYALERPDHQRALIAGALFEIRGAVPNFSAAADRLQVSRTSGRRALDVLTEAHPDLVAMVWKGRLNLHAGVRLAELDPEAQNEVVARVGQGIKIETMVPLKPDNQPRKTDMRQAKSRTNGANDVETLRIVASQLRVLSDYGLADITEFDVSVTPEEAQDLADDMAKALPVLNRVKRMLQKRSTPHD